MKLIIDIPEETYEIIANINDFYNMSRTAVRIEKQEIGLAIKNGTPLSEELEEIKAEMDVLYGCYNPHFKERLVLKSDVMQILDKYISELKGARNG